MMYVCRICSVSLILKTKKELLHKMRLLYLKESFCGFSLYIQGIKLKNLSYSNLHVKKYAHSIQYSKLTMCKNYTQ